MEQLNEGQIWTYFWVIGGLIFLAMYLIIKLYCKIKNKRNERK